jgi:hypothetical protein
MSKEKIFSDVPKSYFFVQEYTWSGERRKKKREERYRLTEKRDVPQSYEMSFKNQNFSF